MNLISLSIAIGSSSYERVRVLLRSTWKVSFVFVSFWRGVDSYVQTSRMRTSIHTHEQKQQQVPVLTLSLSENDDGDSSDSNPIDFCSSNDLLAAASGDMIKIFKIQSGHRVRVLSSIKLKTGVRVLRFRSSHSSVWRMYCSGLLRRWAPNFQV